MEANNDLIQFVTTTKNKQKLVYRGQCYTLKRRNCNDKCWSYEVQQRRVAAFTVSYLIILLQLYDYSTSAPFIIIV
ncbi:hypothetical protein T07_14080 [Trichinella nelsoni]|uniref:FLYWCH-type domain-containing protein n=1 Tax=Trichinella nelsoni TaxID=6336 RepID=A0A0V0RFD5_9BILA|nr:hypothetical protein T07_14080 [Trichinella nelsoni]